MPRDTLRDKAYYDEYVEYSCEVINEDAYEVKEDEKNSAEIKMKFAFGLVTRYLSLMHEKYARGDDVSKLKFDLLSALEYRNWQKHYADLLPENEQHNRIGWEEIREDYLESQLQWLAFAYCLDMGQDYYQQVFALIANQGQDALYDAIAVKMGDTEREVSDTLLFKKRFSKLYDVIRAPEDKRPELMLAYLEAWYKLEGSPDLHLMDTDTYKGYWSWEAALVTKLYAIDDTRFIDHQYYPKDLVHANA